MGIEYIKNVKKSITWRQSAGIRNISYFKVLQRLHARDLTFAMFVGLIDGKGWFSISYPHNYKFFLIFEMGISPTGTSVRTSRGRSRLELYIRDVQLRYKIKKLLGIGNISFRLIDEKNKMVSFKIHCLKDLKNIIFPIFDKYPLLTNKYYDFLRFKDLHPKGVDQGALRASRLFNKSF